MKKNPLSKDVLPHNFIGIGSVTVERVRARAREIALLAGHAVGDVTPADFEQAKRELLDESDKDPKEAFLESAPESDRWNPVPGSAGHQAPESPPEDEDEEGRSETEQLVNEGVEEAERDQMIQASRAAVRQGKRSS